MMVLLFEVAPEMARVTWLIAACATFAWPPVVFSDSGRRGVLAPVVTEDDGGTRLPGESRNKLGME
jgi:hypothetical protein